MTTSATNDTSNAETIATEKLKESHSMRLSSLDIYETSTHFYIIGTDSTKIKFHVLKLDRNAEQSFLIGEPNHSYTRKDVDELLSTISSSSVVTSQKSRSSGNALLQTIKGAYGIIGAVRFLEGYHLLVITKARAVALLGHHDIYKIEEVQSVYIPSLASSAMSPDEQRYAKLFQSVDLTTNFYFSYTYDLSRTLQENALAQRELKFNKTKYHRKIDADRKFIWNDYLLKPFKDNLVTDKWCIEIVHGYVGQQIIELPCSKLALILIGRRSAIFAGTRFLKRGMDISGAVANDVETEQIVWDMYSTPSIVTGNFTAYVQRRGSIPLFWSQDPSTRGVVGKPPVIVDLVEPNAFTTAAHFKDLRHKYGYPISIINLVKRRGGPKTQDEKMLHAQFLKTVRYLNQFMKPGKKIDYISFDVARCNKTGLVLQRLEQIGIKLILKQGWFQSFKPLRVREMMKHSSLENFIPHLSDDGEMLLQSGISRTNCVDCLDRTNVSQFGLGKAALGFQLYSMGYLDEPHISTTSELCRVYEDMYDEHGDTMAWQYAGSHLVHSIKTYKKTAAFQERSRDVIQTISRYYSNTFNDYEKQNGINLFLGLFRPFAHIRPHLWDLFTDRYLHFPIKREPKIKNHIEWVQNVNSESEDEMEEDDEWTDWFKEYPEDRELYGIESYRTLDSDSCVPRTSLPTPETLYWKFHKELEISNFEQILKEISQQTNKKVISLSDLNQSIFQTGSFMKLWKTPETAPIGGKKGPLGSFTNPEEDEDDEEMVENASYNSEEELFYNEDFNPPFLSSRQGSNSPTQNLQRSVSPFVSSTPSLGIDTGLKSSTDFYGFEITEPSGQNLEKYERYANIAEKERQYLEITTKNGQELPRDTSSLQLEPLLEFSPSIFTVDSIFETEILGATENAINIYKEYVSLKDNFIAKNNIPDSWNSFVM